MDIVEELKRNPESGARRLEAEYKAGLMSLARRFCHDEGDAEELVNRTFAEVVEDIDGFLAQSSFFTWIVSILNNLHAMDCRRKSHQTVVYPGIVPDVADESAQDEIYRNIDATFVRDAVESLPKEMRDVVVMHFLMEQPIAKVAQFLSLPVSTVKWRLHIARKELARRLGATVENAAKKPGGKAVIMALLLCGLTALGAAVWHLAVPGEAQTPADAGMSLVASRVSSSEAETTGHATSDTRQAEDYVATQSAADCRRPSATENPSLTSQGEQNMNITQTTRAAMLAATTLAMQTALPATAAGATLKLTTNDAGGNSSLVNWDASSSSPKGAPVAGNDYLITDQHHARVCSSTDKIFFKGDSLTLGETGGHNQHGSYTSPSKTGRFIFNANKGLDFSESANGLILVAGYWVGWTKSTLFPAVSGKMTVLSPESEPFVFCPGDGANASNTLQIATTTVGEAGTAVQFSSRAITQPGDNKSFIISGNWSGFKGKWFVCGGNGNGNKNRFWDYEPVEVATYATLGGTAVVEKGGTIRAAWTGSTFTTAGLELQDGSKLRIWNKAAEATCGRINVTESLVVGGDVTVILNSVPPATNTNGIDWVVLTLPQNKGTIPLEKLHLVLTDSNNANFPNAYPRYTLVTNAVDNVLQLICRKTPHVFLKQNDETSTTINDNLPSALETADSWMDGVAPRAGFDYVAEDGKGGLPSKTWPVIRTPYYSNTSTPFVFAGDTLALGAGSQVLPCSKDVTFPRLVLSQNSTYVLSLASVPSYLRGSLYLRASSDNYPQKIQTYMRGLNTVAAEVSGPGTLNVMGRSGSSKPYGDIEFTALNTNYTGRIKVLANVNNVSPAQDDYKHERVFVTDARNLGGPLPEFRADALELADYSVLEARNDVDMNVANRGVKVTGNAGFAAPTNVTLAISNDITWNGTARKTGAGTLALGGAPRIASGATAALAVKEGYLQALATNAVDGVSVTFADGAYLLVNAAATGDVATFGAVDLSATPFGGMLPVAFDFPGGVPEGDETLTVAVATVADAAKAQSLELSARKISKHSVEFSHRTNADGTVTILAKIYKPAFVIVIR